MNQVTAGSTEGNSVTETGQLSPLHTGGAAAGCLGLGGRYKPVEETPGHTRSISEISPKETAGTKVTQGM